MPTDSTYTERGPRALSLRRLPRTVILAATQNDRFSAWSKRYGLRLGATRFVAGERMEDCVRVIRALNQEGLMGYAVVLGESVEDRADAEAAVDTYRRLARTLAAERLNSTMSMKLTHVGLSIDEQLAFEGARAILSAAAEDGIFVRLDMESSGWVDPTLAIYKRLTEAGMANTGVVLQAYLHRTTRDLESLLDAAPNLRLVKGAYLEHPSIAFSRKADVDRNYLRMIDLALDGPGFTAIATHDERAIGHATRHIAANPGRYAGRYEFQMLYGVRPRLQRRLAAQGHPVRVCVPYGDDWYIYFGRRLAERPANVLFVLRSLLAR